VPTSPLVPRLVELLFGQGLVVARVFGWDGDTACVPAGIELVGIARQPW